MLLLKIIALKINARIETLKVTCKHWRTAARQPPGSRQAAAECIYIG
jgi:hypothetical protein